MCEKVMGTVDISNMIVNKYSKDKDEIISIENIGDVNLKEGDTIGIALRKAKNIASLELIGFSNKEEYIIETSLDNKTWNSPLIQEDGEFLELVVAKYIRIRAIKDTSISLYEIEIYLVGNVIIERKLEAIEYIIKEYSNSKMKRPNRRKGIREYLSYITSNFSKYIETIKYRRDKCFSDDIIVDNNGVSIKLRGYVNGRCKMS